MVNKTRLFNIKLPNPISKNCAITKLISGEVPLKDLKNIIECIVKNKGLKALFKILKSK